MNHLVTMATEESSRLFVYCTMILLLFTVAWIESFLGLHTATAPNQI